MVVFGPALAYLALWSRARWQAGWRPHMRGGWVGGALRKALQMKGRLAE